MPSFVVDDALGWAALAGSGLPDSGVTPGTYGDATHVGQFTVDAHGIITAASSVGITGGGSGVTVAFNEVTTDEFTTSTTYTNLTTPGPAVTVTVGASGIAMLGVSCQMGVAATTNMAAALSGANTVAASDEWALTLANGSGSGASRVYVFTGLSSGSTTFTAKYRSPSSASVDFLRRQLWVLVP